MNTSFASLRSIVAAALLAVAFVPAAHALTYQVGPGRPITQISAVAGLLNPGDVVEVDGNATYNTVLLTRSGSAALPITIRGMATGAQRPVINSNGAHDDALRMDVSHYVIEDLVVSGARLKCVYLHGHNLTLRRVQVHTCRDHGILGADNDTGDLTLTEVEVFNSGNAAAPSQFHHPIYIATDHVLYPNAVLRIEKSWVHDNHSGNSIKSRARNGKFFYNWLETTNAQNHTIEAIGPDGQTCPVFNGSNAAQLCNAEIVGNVLIARGNNANMMRLGGDGTGQSFGRYHVVNNTFIANSTFNSTSAAMIRAFDGIESIELHNNIFWIQQGDVTGVRIVRDIDAGGNPEADWVNGRRVTGTRNLVTGSASTYASGVPAQAIQGLTNTIFVPTTGPIFAGGTPNPASPAAMDLRLAANSVARLAGNAGSTSTAGYQIPNPTNLPLLQPPQMRPSPGTFAATPRPLPTENDGQIVAGTIGLGAYEFATGPLDLNGNGKADLLLRHTDGSVYLWIMDTYPVSGDFLATDTTGWSVTHLADFDGDGRADILMKHTNGSVKVIRMNGTTVVSGALLLGAGTPWTVTHTGDVNGDGRSDLVLRNTDGSVYIWTMNIVPTGGNFLGTDTNGWLVTHVADFNGDGRADIVMRHTDGSIKSLQMDGTTITAGYLLLGPGNPWTLTHTGDVDGDGRADMILKHTDGSVFIWLMNGAPTGGNFLGTDTNGWVVTHVADFNGDGRMDILMRHTDASIKSLLLNGTTITNGYLLLGPGNPWTVTHTLDTTGDGKADMVLRHADQAIYLWVIDGLPVTGAFLLNGPQPWTVVPPAP